ncbi:MarR family transcriptional regulator [Natrinema amylolyticum]|uniref:MarR family transcriptional regulator n=1 Tax=Natrinema amylolyticum TaxID=2878679 RepID=UPI001CFA4082|nr:helix-turn-helix domain-containing protein [Natrinema amylolyticum]
MPEQLPKDVADEPPAARLVYLALEDRPMTVEEIVDCTGLSKKSIRDSGRLLEDKGVIEIETHPHDARKGQYRRTEQ